MEDEQADAGALGTGGATISQLRRGVTPAPGTTLGRDVQSKIGQHLRAMYDDVVRQGVPDRFLDLLAQLDEPANSEGKDGKASGEGKQR
ncbi:hypothetical protein MWN34_03820 [Ancylobacter sp. 6x-1]|uniref:Anti-sigma factor NepR domain-containing protein n=1 Tax=Ancylobacter crimeensis TaxID=2579147 RepID=A0ABT0D7V9_9HYPH|nr:NepR family anti-sigma factor [Ancylobacter crimeensis]MCK0196034.1 hypothetical protein [Ancylobacter crimeensis]